MDSNDRKFRDAPNIKMLAVANSLLNMPIDRDVIESLPVSVIQEFALGTRKIVVSPKQARYIRTICIKWRDGVDSGKFNDVTGPLAMSDPDFQREVLQPLAFFNEPEVARDDGEKPGD
jgi:hypothetical protein